MIDEKATKKVIAIAGPTASGKTALAVQLAQFFRTKIISFDSRQCYREMYIGTAAPTTEEQQGIQHYFIQSHSIHDPVSAGKFKTLAEHWLEEIFRTNDTAILTGGTGLYIQTLLEGIHDLPSISTSSREHIKQVFIKHGLPALQEIVKSADPEYYQTADVQNPARLMRAAEVIFQTGLPYSSFINREKNYQFPYQVEKYAIGFDRTELYARIDRRVDLMMEKGLLKEVENLYGFRHLQTLSTVGYSELFEYLDGKTSIESAVENIKQHSRNYAKRQITWFRNKGGYTFLSAASIFDKVTGENH